MCVCGGGGAADFPRALTSTYMAGNNKPAYLHQIDITDFVICSMPKLRIDIKLPCVRKRFMSIIVRVNSKAHFFEISSECCSCNIHVHPYLYTLVKHFSWVAGSTQLYLLGGVQVCLHAMLIEHTRASVMHPCWNIDIYSKSFINASLFTWSTFQYACGNTWLRECTKWDSGKLLPFSAVCLCYLA